MRPLSARAATCASVALALLALAVGAANAQSSTCVTGSTFTCTGALTTASPLFNSPNFGLPPTTQADIVFGSPPTSKVFFYDALAFRVSLTGLYAFNATATYDQAQFLYLGSFNPASPLDNIIFGASNVPFTGNPGIPISTILSAASTYVLVASSFDFLATGNFTNMISCPVSASNPNGTCAPSQISVVVSAVPEPNAAVLCASGMLALAMLARRRRVRAS